MVHHVRQNARPSSSSILPRRLLQIARHRALVRSSIDMVAWVLGLTSAMVLRFDFSLEPKLWGDFTPSRVALAIAVAVVVQCAAGFGTGLYTGRWRLGSFEETSHVAFAALVPTLVLFVVNASAAQRLVPTGVVVVGGTIALGAMVTARYGWRLVLERRLRPSVERAEPVVVFGAGEGGVQLLTSMLRNPDSPYVPVALLDDDPAKRNLRIMGVPVLGGRDDLAEVAASAGAALVVIAVPGATSSLLRELCDLALAAQLQVRTLPPVSELLGGPVGVGDLRPVTEADLLGRHAIDTDVDSIAGYLTGRRVLVTGAGGSIGSELCAQVVRFAPAQLVMLDRDESALHAVQLRLEGRAMLDDRNLVVRDIRDRDGLAAVFAEHRPEVVFHAAALKHLPLLEMHPAEAVKTNVEGTANLLELSAAHGVDRFINISTDKAADPTSVLGYSKRVAECLTADAADRAHGTYLSVRFGNVLGSRGSVLTAFAAQIAAGGPVTVTHPDVTRYFMTVEEAVQLVVQAGAVGRDGEVLVLDMGKPVRIEDVARRLVAQATRPVEIVHTGLRPGEKLHEALFGSGELDQRPVHPLISHVTVPPLTLADVRARLAAAGNGDDAVRRGLAELCRVAAVARTSESAGSERRR